MNREPRNLQPPGDTASARTAGFRVGAILAGLLPFVVLEIALRVFNVGAPANQSDPLAGFNRQQPLFEKAGGTFHTVRTRETFFNPQQFAAIKSTNGFRVFCFGGSTVFGHPYLSDTAFPKWLQLELAARSPTRSIEVVNCGGISYASYRLAPIVREVLQYQPDLIVIATGENEFLEDRTYQQIKSRSAFRRSVEEKFFALHTATLIRQWLSRDQDSTLAAAPPASPALSAEVNARLDDARSGYASYHRDAAWHRQVVDQFGDSMRAMIADCRGENVPLLLVTLGSNLRDCPPYKSEHKGDLKPDEESRWQSGFDAATAAEAKDPQAALALYQSAEAIDNQHALLAFRQARLLDRLGQPARAREYYLRAKDQDVCPLRMLDQVYELQHRLTAETSTPLVDVRKLLESLAPDQLPGNDLYLDHVHPTIGGNQRIAQAVAAKALDLRLLPNATEWTAAARRATYHRHFQQLDAAYFTNGRRRVEWLENWAQRQKLAGETIPKEASEFLRHGFRSFELGAEEEAWKFFFTALEKDPQNAKSIINRARQLHDEGRSEAAQQLVNRLGRVVISREVKSAIDQTSALFRQDLTPAR